MQYIYPCITSECIEIPRTSHLNNTIRLGRELMKIIPEPFARILLYRLGSELNFYCNFEIIVISYSVHEAFLIYLHIYTIEYNFLACNFPLV